VAVLIDAVVYYIMVVYQITTPSIAKRISFIVGSIWVFVANKFFTFKQPKFKISEFPLFALLYTCTLLINSFIHDLVLDQFRYEGLAFIFATGTSTILNYIGQKWIVFKNKSL
jgi:putative flippase GtrA